MGHKLKQRFLPAFREELLVENSGKCPICGLPIEDGEAVLDHDHKTGFVRNTIHRDCNILVGKVENYVRTRGVGFRDMERLHSSLCNIAEYISKDYSEMPFHPTHKTPEEKEISRLRKRIRAAKKQETKDRLQSQIREIQNAKS